MGFEGKPVLIVLYFIICSVAAQNPTPLNCTDTSRLCTSFLAFKPSSDQTLAVLQSMFDVLQEDITVEGNDRDYVFIKKNCSCASGLNKYLTSTTFTVRENNGSVYDLVVDSYDGLAYFPSNFTRAAKRGLVVSLRLMCGCSSGLWNYLMSYVMQDGDNVESLASRFGVSMDSIETVNGISDPDNVTIGALYYIPLNSGMVSNFILLAVWIEVNFVWLYVVMIFLVMISVLVALGVVDLLSELFSATCFLIFLKFIRLENNGMTL